MHLGVPRSLSAYTVSFMNILERIRCGPARDSHPPPGFISVLKCLVVRAISMRSRELVGGSLFSTRRVQFQAELSTTRKTHSRILHGMLSSP